MGWNMAAFSKTKMGKGKGLLVVHVTVFLEQEFTAEPDPKPTPFTGAGWGRGRGREGRLGLPFQIVPSRFVFLLPPRRLTHAGALPLNDMLRASPQVKVIIPPPTTFACREAACMTLTLTRGPALWQPQPARQEPTRMETSRRDSWFSKWQVRAAVLSAPASRLPPQTDAAAVHSSRAPPRPVTPCSQPGAG